ncbi:MAG: hypothetical protein H6577_03540 [Lewinellaceae bacterium]|nr:hypothetical protein [Saprospiraceae bacterium]MCB9337177.1 hypothetical protein [Lewinellaceae bacterium]
MLKTKVKATGVNNLTDARYFAAREVEWLGLPLGAGMAGTLSVAAANTLKEWVDGVKIVGEFDFPTSEEMLEIHNSLGLDGVQAGMFTPVEELLPLNGINIIKQVVVSGEFSQQDIDEHLRQYAHCCHSFLLDFTRSAITWEGLKNDGPFSLDFIKSLAKRYKIILAIECMPGMFDELLEIIQPYGISLTGGAEEKVGYKSFDDLDGLLDALELNEY